MTCIVKAITNCFCPPAKPTHRKGRTIEVSASKVAELSQVQDLKVGETMSVPFSRRDSFEESQRRNSN